MEAKYQNEMRRNEETQMKKYKRQMKLEDLHKKLVIYEL